ncbi:ParA family protein [Burkholderia sp. Ac-20365]|uniref:ParA family protein n=1 Tax=Burkholderia sp. Ac-20365 TaxID=2703897 RepID=UPI00197B5C6A|nr:ParA family protein [Burkholderia sp. Ac-20365]MBN3761048.1 ParA family protein [Burkholderia sp. Ac-20365]
MPAKILAVANQKGGVGKTTTTVSICTGLHHAGYKVLGVDADPQTTLSQWAAAAPEDEEGLPFMVVSLHTSRHNIHRELKKLIEDYDFIVVDCPPSVEDPRPAAVMLVSEAVIIPVSSSPADFWSSEEFISEVIKVQRHNPDLRPIWLLNKTEGKRKLDQSVIGAIVETCVPQFERVVPTRECYKQACALGRTVFKVGGSGSKLAQVEVTAIVKELLQRLKEPAPYIEELREQRRIELEAAEAEGENETIAEA